MRFSESGVAGLRHGDRSRRTRVLPALAASVAGVVGLSMLGAPALAEPDGAATAGPGADDGGLSGTADDFQEFKAGRYLVMMSAPPATGYAKTRVRGDRSFNSRTAAVRAYSNRLTASHDDLADDLGFDVERNFTIAANGFVADLTADQATELAGEREVLLVEKDSIVEADTWNTPDHLGLDGKQGMWKKFGGYKNAGDGVVVGIIDSGIWPESKSFAGAPLTKGQRTKWDIARVGSKVRMEKADGQLFTGECEAGEEFTADLCNRKLITARYFVDGYGEDRLLDEDYLSPRDGNGHGSHTASTAAGNHGVGARVEGVRFGRISGMAPAAKIASYKALWATEDGSASGATSDLVSAIDQAVADGVDVINYSISGSTDTTLESAELAFEGAAEAGIFVAASAGNSGPEASTVAHNSPWLTTVAANTHTSFENTLQLGNGTKIVGASIAKEALGSTPLVDAMTVGNGSTTDADTALCAPDSLDPAAVAGKIVVCERGTYDRVAKSEEVERAGGVGMVLANVSEGSLDADFHAVPTIHVSHTDSPKVYNYLERAGDGATAKFLLGNKTGKTTVVPQIAGFSSRGPAASDNGDLLKPDISAPGVSVLAAVAPPSNSGRNFDLYSGTSMSAPHVAGLAAFMLGERPTWSPMKIKSAMMTTATSLRTEDGKASRDLFAQGSGEVTPKRMFNPGLFVLSDGRQWRGYLAGLGLDTGVAPVAAKDVNVPSLAQGYVMSETSFTRTFTATRKGTWRIKVNVPGFKATTSKSQVVSRRTNDLEQVKFSFQRTTAPLSEYAFGYITLTGPTTVRLPVALRPVSVKAPSSVQGSGVDGNAQVDITGGFDGELQASTQGLVQGQVDEGTVPEGAYTLACVTIGEGNELAQFDLVAPDPASDLDMAIYASGSCNPADITALAGEAATPSSGETFSIEGAPAGDYIVQVVAYSAGTQEPVPYSLRAYDVGGVANEGSLTVTPNPVPVSTGADTSFETSWSGLQPDAHYLGILGYDGAPNSTYLYVDTGAE
ncbi:S8 family peptidase [Nocardioides sambongensis]|uniref:S8 family peptidase n=1 Tax=Nocardioides sambongensis TaxID=2589074 RepID=UPI00112BB47C|nr:S8 family serine peptidase [Nocardioides sambongensis]